MTNTDPDIKAVEDRGEAIALMEPMLLAEGSSRRAALTDLALELAQKSAGFRRSLPESLTASLAEFVRAMNCYYSNLIEGHDTHPIDIERALKGDYSHDARKRDLQLEASAHIAVQKWIDGGSLRGRAVTVESIKEIHQRFCAELPDNFLWSEDPARVLSPETEGKARVAPGQIRHRDVAVGRHIPISAPAIPRFLDRLEEVYGRLGKTETILAAAAAHHRLVWIHPFLDGNGRVARLMSHATLLETLDTGGLWSIARGLARNADSYKGHLAECDLPRRNDLDGRGHLSEEALAEFTSFFLRICLDQVSFMERLMHPDALHARLLLWAEEEVRLNHLPPKSGAILEAVLYRGDLPRAGVAAIVGTGERQGRRIVAALVARGVLTATNPRAPLRLAFPASLAPRLMPGLFPERVT